MKKILMLLCILLLCSCNKDKYISKNLYYMDTLINIKIYNTNSKKANDAINYIDNLFNEYENITSRYNTNSELYKLNNTYGEVDVSPSLYQLIEIGVDWYEKSDGLLNINIGSLTSIWKDFRENNHNLPDLDTLNKASIDINKIKLLGNNKIKNEGFSIDLGSIVKGYVTELAGEYLESIGINYYIINAGGNVKLGKSYKDNYVVGVQSPNDNSSFIKLKLQNKSVVTSGGYERFYEIDGIKYHHIIDPNTRYPANKYKSVTVIGDNSGICDALSTILFLMDMDSSKELIKYCNVDVIWYTMDDEIIKSEGFRYE